MNLKDVPSFCKVKPRAKSLVGTIGYMAPEVLNILVHGINNGYTDAVDWWSLGAMMYKMYTGSRPYATSCKSIKASNPSDAFIKSDSYDAISATADANMRCKGYTVKPLFDTECKLNNIQAEDLITNLLLFDESHRLGSGIGGDAEILTHEYFHNIDWELLKMKKMVPPPLPNHLLKGKSRMTIEKTVTLNSLDELLRRNDLNEWLYEDISVDDEVNFNHWDQVSNTMIAEEVQRTSVTAPQSVYPTHCDKEYLDDHSENSICYLPNSPNTKKSTSADGTTTPINNINNNNGSSTPINTNINANTNVYTDIKIVHSNNNSHMEHD